jgi:hypothetical protein
MIKDICESTSLFNHNFYLTISVVVVVVVLAQIFEIFLMQQDSVLFVLVLIHMENVVHLSRIDQFRYFHDKHHVRSNQHLFCNAYQSSLFSYRLKNVSIKILILLKLYRIMIRWDFKYLHPIQSELRGN